MRIRRSLGKIIFLILLKLSRIVLQRCRKIYNLFVICFLLMKENKLFYIFVSHVLYRSGEIPDRVITLLRTVWLDLVIYLV